MITISVAAPMVRLMGVLLMAGLEFGESIKAAGAPPSITVQPQSKSASIGATVVFNVTASGTAPLSYQWRRNLSDLPSGTNVSFSLANVQTADAGEYQVAIMNSSGSI